MEQGSKMRLVILATMICSVMGIITDDNSHGGPVHRARRSAYTPHLAYMNKVNPISDDYGPNDNFYKRYMLGRDQDVNPISHFREFRQQNQHQNIFRNRPEASLPAQDSVQGSASQYSRNIRRLTVPTRKTIASSNMEDFSNVNQLTPLSDEEIQTILLLLNGYALSSKGGNQAVNYNSDDAIVPTSPEEYYNPNYLSQEDLRRLARLYATNSKRESSQQGRFFDLEQPASLDNEDPEKLEFLTPKRSKRVGIHHIAQEPTGRFKKETDPKVVAQLEKVFNGPKALPLSIANDKGGVTTDKAVVSTPGHSGSSSATGQIPAPGHVHSNKAAKKSIDWSEYFGIDKKSPEMNHNHDATVSSTVIESTKANKHSDDDGKAKEDSVATTNADSTALPIPSSKPKAARITEPTKTGIKETKDHKKLRAREENETENKSDRKWILNEFYKNLAMSTNVRKRKRDVSTDEADELADLEQKMALAGDDIISDVLKYTGRSLTDKMDRKDDDPLSNYELAQVKKEIIEKLAAAYNLEKIREAVEEFREQLLAMKTNNV